MNERAIFMEALEKDSLKQRSSYLDEACAGDAALRRRVEALLGSHEQAGSFLGKPVPERLAEQAAEPRDPQLDGTVDESISERAGTVIGPYKLMEQIGEGGMGLIFVAEQQSPVRRKVAIKVIKPGMDTRDVIARFEAERQALALMDHPNIARVFDAGATASGRPYFVMELVRGVGITQFCDENRLNPRERLELFIHVCQAVQHAHQKGIIHRDLKATNILVTLHDGTPVVKVIDFGVAKAIGQQLTEKTIYTRFAQMIGTPMYMSPEQAEMSGLDIDTRSDIYALGVLLYELLTGATPFDRERLKTASYDEIRRIVREEEPPRPSQRISTLVAATLTVVSAQRNTDPKRLGQLFRGELDWIVMKALEKDRNLRYESASAFAADVQRYLRDEPVLACPPSAWYRFRKFARRKKALLATASAVGLAALVAVGVLATSTVLIAQALQAETKAKNDLNDVLKRERRDSYFHRIALAQSELSVHNLGRALELLEQCPEDLRDWEWRYLQRLCKVDPLTLHGEGQGIRGVAFSPNGQSIAAANEDGSIGRFDLKSGARLPALRGHRRKVRSVAYHPDGTRLASVSTDLTVKLWDLTTGQVIQTFEGNEGTHAGSASGVAFSPDGKLLAAGSDHGSVVLCNAMDGRVLKRLGPHERMALCVAFSPDSRLLATGSWSGKLRLWDAKTGDLAWSSEGETSPLSSVAFSPDGRFLATTGYDRLVTIWDVATRKPLRSWRGHECIILGVAYSADGGRLATIGGEDKTVKLWDPHSGREILKLRGHTVFGACVAFSPDGRQLASSGLDGTIRIWDASPASTGQELMTLKHDDEVWSVAVSPDGQRIASAGFDKTMRIWDLANGALLYRMVHPGLVYMVAFSRDGQRIASTGRDKAARIFDAATGAKLREFRTRNNHLYGVAFSPDGQFLVVDDVDGKHLKDGGNHAVSVWDAHADQPEPKEIGVIGRHVEDVWCLKFSPDGTLLATGCNDGNVKLWRWDAANPGKQQEPLHILPVRNYGFGDCMAFTPDSQRLVTATGDKMQIWNVKAGTEVAKLEGHSGDVIAVAVSQNGRWLASAGEDTTIVLWDTATWERKHTLRGHTGMVMSLSFSRDNERLVSGSRDKSVKVWDMTGK